VTGETAAEPRFARLLPGASVELSADELLADWGADAGGEAGDGVALNMIASVDGRIAVRGRSGPLGSRADRALFHALRARADAVMAGAGTVRSERYGPIIRDPDVRQRRRRQGLEAQPLAVIVSRSLELDPTLPLLADADSRVIVLTEGAGELVGCAAAIEYVRRPTLRASLAELRTRWRVRTILCEGGPRLNGSLAAESLIDELFVSLAPLLVGDVPRGGEMVEDGAPASPRPLELRLLAAHGSHLFAHYGAV
jgi:riboflavin biosynthesis pyrimidine reductase